MKVRLDKIIPLSTMWTVVFVLFIILPPFKSFWSDVSLLLVLFSGILSTIVIWTSR